MTLSVTTTAIIENSFFSPFGRGLNERIEKFDELFFPAIPH